MPDKTIQLSRRRFLAGFATIGGASAAAGSGTMAYFSDTETSSDNTVQTGTLDLKLGGEDKSVQVLNARNMKPGDEGSGDLELENYGSLPGELEIEVSNIHSVDRNGSSPGDLEEYLEVQAEAGTTEVIERQTVSELGEGVVSTSQITVPAEESVTFWLNWWLPSDTKNKARGDEVQLSFTFRLVQGGGS